MLAQILRLSGSLLGWKEEHEEEIRGKQVQWHKEVKEQVFADEEHIPVKIMTEKMDNMRKAWKDAKAMQERSGWGVKPEVNEESINEILERKCPFFWRLEEIWGSRPNATVIFVGNTLDPEVCGKVYSQKGSTVTLSARAPERAIGDLKNERYKQLESAKLIRFLCRYHTRAVSPSNRSLYTRSVRIEVYLCFAHTHSDYSGLLPQYPPS